MSARNADIVDLSSVAASRPVARRRLSEEVAGRVQQAIVGGRLRPGDRLPPEAVLAAQFSVSRTAIREAMRALAERGLVRIHQGQGTFVTRPSSLRASDLFTLYLRLNQSTVFDLLEARRAIEVEAANLAAARHSKKDLKALRHTLRTMKDYVANGNEAEPKPYVDADIAFHLTIADASRNHILGFVLTTLRELLRENIRQALQVAEARSGSVQGHERILRALESGDAQAAGTAMAQHIDDVRSWIEKQHAARGRTQAP